MLTLIFVTMGLEKVIWMVVLLYVLCILVGNALEMKMTCSYQNVNLHVEMANSISSQKHVTMITLVNMTAVMKIAQ